MVRKPKDEGRGRGRCVPFPKTSGHWAVLGAAHEGVGTAFEGLVEDAGAAGDDGDSCEGLEEAGVEGGDAAAEGAEVEAGSGGDDDHEGDARLAEGGVVGEEGVGLRGEDLVGGRGESHMGRISRLGLLQFWLRCICRLRLRRLRLGWRIRFLR